MLCDGARGTASESIWIAHPQGDDRKRFLCVRRTVDCLRESESVIRVGAKSRQLIAPSHHLWLGTSVEKFRKEWSQKAIAQREYRRSVIDNES